MSVIVASFERSLKAFLRDRTILASSLMLPVFFLLILPLLLFSDIPSEIVGSAKGGLTVAMITLLIMSMGMGNLTGSIVGDRERGLYGKLSSMPVMPWQECFGRVLAVLLFCMLSTFVLLFLGVVYGAHFTASLIGVMGAVVVGLFIALASVGVGLILASLIRSESAATHVGIGLTMIVYFTGIALPEWSIPDSLLGYFQIISQLNPLSAGYNLITILVVDSGDVGFALGAFLELCIMVFFSLVLFLVGLAMYSRRCWK